ncbi:MAG: hypothetical protein IT370_12460 [Deltaproteobacteria bacterium]|nr:hypothetical protein [Deltaproteobacteria bacterium]
MTLRRGVAAAVALLGALGVLSPMGQARPVLAQRDQLAAPAHRDTQSLACTAPTTPEVRRPALTPSMLPALGPALLCAPMRTITRVVVLGAEAPSPNRKPTHSSVPRGPPR